MAGYFLTVSLSFVVGVRDVPSQVEVEWFLMISLDEGECFLGEAVMGIGYLLRGNIALSTVDVPREPFLGLVAVEMFGIVVMGLALIQITIKKIESLLVWMPGRSKICLLYTSPSPRDQRGSRMPSSA